MKFVRRSQSELKNIIVKTIIVNFLLVLFVFFSFREMRAMIPPPEITGEKLVGFAQYFGYPLYFDTYIFALIILLPVLIFIFFSFKRK
jgi:hypothetical protein